MVITLKWIKSQRLAYVGKSSNIPASQLSIRSHKHSVPSLKTPFAACACSATGAAAIRDVRSAAADTHFRYAPNPGAICNQMLCCELSKLMAEGK